MKAPIRPAAAIACTLAILAGAGAASAAEGAAYPQRPIRFIVPFPPGGGNDIVGRIVAQGLSEGLSQSVVVDNRGGAGGTIGTDLTAKAPADGHTMLVNNISLAVNATLMPKLAYDTLRDLAPVSIIGRQPNILVVHPAMKAKTVKELLAAARAKPGAVNYGSGGVGTASHLATEMLLGMTNTRATHVPYRGFAPALTDLLAGQIDFTFDPGPGLPQVRSGKLRMLAVGSMKRTPLFPDVPTLDELGLKGFDADSFFGFYAPAGVDAAIIERMNKEINAILATPAVSQRIADLGGEVAAMTPEAFAEQMRKDADRFGKLIRERGIKVE